MAEGFELYHVPQQSRRDKLRVGVGSGAANNPNFLPLYHHHGGGGGGDDDDDDPSSLISTDFDFHQNPSFNLHNHNHYPPTPTAAYATAAHHLPPLLPDQQPPLSLDLNLQHRYASSPTPLLTSKFLKPAQQLLHDLFHYADKLPPDSPLLDSLGGDIPTAALHHDPTDDGIESRRRKSRLITMLDEVYRRYKLYYQQMQAVVTTFEYVGGLGNAAPYVNLAVKAMFKHFRFLKNAIADQLQLNKQHQQPPPPPPYNPYCQRSIHNNSGGFVDHQPVWRPQRGLPESAVTVLRAWLFEHFLHPYPTDTDKLMLANQTGLSRSQVSNWFINARVRLWKPMVEEIHMLETREAQKSQHRDANNGTPLNNNNNNDDHHHLSSTNQSLNNASSSNHDQHPLHLSNSNFFPTHHPHPPAGATTMGAGNVSLTLGLHQNHAGITLTEPFPINAAQHFNLGLEANGEGFVNEWF
ncbi:BEL1-like homeodomain protein 9 [Cucurbita pepo subsp. pepo]|uniref:BEL1-like homeodomain protein 9 n=1 Tax=Cucurbita pepo subsp. pepo TaxID=3664 RepID=UPI000C9DA386|nr:BEL1-like homeodomain protein 9 [Cucurbita pepo subsp. pepo]